MGHDRLIAIIPARGGSKRIPRKNIKEFQGIPAIGSTIIELLNSQLFSNIIVTTDDAEIAKIALQFGATDIVMRPDDLSSDQAITVPTIAHALKSWGEDIEHEISNDDFVCCVYPVNPFFVPNDLYLGLDILKKNTSITYVNPVCTFPYPIERALTLDSDLRIEMLDPSKLEVRSQDTIDAFHDAGQWYLARADSWLRKEPLLVNSIGVKIPRWRVQDIDTEEDWVRAEILREIILKRQADLEGTA
jgi:N-acylneuraminate cytidylyltransferase